MKNIKLTLIILFIFNCSTMPPIKDKEPSATTENMKLFILSKERVNKFYEGKKTFTPKGTDQEFFVINIGIENISTSNQFLNLTGFVIDQNSNILIPMPNFIDYCCDAGEKFMGIRQGDKYQPDLAPGETIKRTLAYLINKNHNPSFIKIIDLKVNEKVPLDKNGKLSTDVKILTKIDIKN